MTMDEAPGWVRASRCHTSSCCVEARLDNGDTLVRQSQDPSGPVLRFSAQEWTEFIDAVKRDEFNLSS